MSAKPDSFERLQTKLHALPQELQDIILQYTCTVTPSARNSAHVPPLVDIPDSTTGVHVDKHYRPPAQLSIPRVRELYAKSYYSTTVFNFTSRAHLVKWVLALPPAHRAYLTELRYEAPGWQESERSIDWNATVWAELTDIEEDFLVNGVLLRRMGREVIYMRAWDFEQHCWTWWNGAGEEEPPSHEGDEGGDEGSRGEKS